MMQFQWKKSKKGSSRFTQFVADHLQSPKQRHSLVVETGFPTSLVDIFVKNRDRMRKSPKDNRSPNHTTTDVVPNTIIPNSLPPLNPPSSLPQRKSTTPNCRIADEIVECTAPDLSNSNAGSVSRSSASGGLAKTGVVGLLMCVLKVFFVVCLALGTKRFVIGITLSAFALFFLELIGNMLYRKFYASSGSIYKLEPSVISRMDGGIDGGKGIKNDLNDFSEHSGEIQIVKTKSCLEQILSSGISLNHFDDILVCEEDLNLKECSEKEEESSSGVLTHQYSRRAKIKSKMKKLIHKNLRKSKTTCSSLKSEGSYPLSCPLQSDTFKDQEQCNKILLLDCQGEEQEQCKNMVLVCQEEKQLLCKEFDGDICTYGESSLAIAKVDEGIERPIEKGSGGFMGLCLIVLFGLVGGRIIALVLALSWCMMLKILARRLSPMLR